MITKPKGTYDLIGNDSKELKALETIIENLMDLYNYEYVRTPVFENSDLFHRSVGETSDIVTKETYDFTDRNSRSLTLRPEGTAGIIRSYIENKTYANESLSKYWYLETMYRYERPQKGRYREFTQFGCEAIGSNSPMLDAEVISIPVILLESLGLKGIKVRLNSLGDEKSRKDYKKALVDYFTPHKEELCPDCQMRLEKNPLRILDCKVDIDTPLFKKVPNILDYLSKESKEYFDEVLKYLNSLDINYEIDQRIIRGLDYYTDTVFEISADVEGFGAQNVICGGGRYDNLINSLGGPNTKAVGFAIGLERLMTALEFEGITLNEENGIDVYLIPMTKETKELAFSLNNTLKIVGFKTEIDFQDRSIKNNFKQADRLNASYTIVIGEDELKEEKLTIKNMHTKQEEKIAKKEVVDYLYDHIVNESNSLSCNCDESCTSGNSCSCDHSSSHKE